MCNFSRGTVLATIDIYCRQMSYIRAAHSGALAGCNSPQRVVETGMNLGPQRLVKRLLFFIVQVCFLKLAATDTPMAWPLVDVTTRTD